MKIGRELTMRAMPRAHSSPLAIALSAPGKPTSYEEQSPGKVAVPGDRGCQIRTVKGLYE